MPRPYEYYVSMRALSTANGKENHALHALLSHASTTANFLSPVEVG